MSIANPTIGERFGITVLKRLANQPTVKWVNTYDAVVVSGEATASTLRELAQALADFEAKFHLNIVEFYAMRVSTYVPDTSPYDANEFIDLTNNARGNVILGDTEPADLETCLLCQRVVEFGRQGRLAYRGVLSEPNVTTNGGQVALANRSSFVSAFATAFVASGLDAFVGNNTAPVQLAMLAPGRPDRIVLAIIPDGVGRVKRTRKWYNRGNPPA